MKTIETLYELVWKQNLGMGISASLRRCIEQGMRWSFSPEGFDRLRSEVTPRMDPFGANGLRDQQCFGLTYVINPDQAEDVRLENTP